MKSRGGRSPGFIATPSGAVIERDRSEHEQWLCVHGESKSGKAWLVSVAPDDGVAVYVPKALLDLGEPCGGFQRMDARCQRVLIAARWCSGPGFIFDEKGLR